MYNSSDSIRFLDTLAPAMRMCVSMLFDPPRLRETSPEVGIPFNSIDTKLLPMLPIMIKVVGR